MIFYDWRSIKLFSKGRPDKIILAIRTLLGEKPRNHRDPLYFFYVKNLTGSSFLVNIEEVLENDFFYKPREIAEYIGIASYRNYAHYALSGDTTLNLLQCPISEKVINNNRLLSIHNGKIHFKYEEVTKEK